MKLIVAIDTWRVGKVFDLEDIRGSAGSSAVRKKRYPWRQKLRSKKEKRNAVSEASLREMCKRWHEEQGHESTHVFCQLLLQQRGALSEHALYKRQTRASDVLDCLKK